jgi:hypothetical protein
LAYEEVHRITGVLHDPYFDPFVVKVIGAGDPLAKAALEMQRRFYPRRVAICLDGQVIGSLPVDEVYIYPSPIPVPAT